LVPYAEERIAGTTPGRALGSTLEVFAGKKDATVVELRKPWQPSPSLYLLPKSQEPSRLKGVMEILRVRATFPILNPTLDGCGSCIKADVISARWQLLGHCRGIDLGERGQENGIRPHHPFLHRDNPPFPSRFEETREEDINLDSSKRGKATKGKMRYAVNWPT
jgi:hypothetical protein